MSIRVRAIVGSNRFRYFRAATPHLTGPGRLITDPWRLAPAMRDRVSPLSEVYTEYSYALQIPQDLNIQHLENVQQLGLQTGCNTLVFDTLFLF